MYRTRPEVGAHERQHTEAFFRRIKFWNEMQSQTNAASSNKANSKQQNGEKEEGQTHSHNNADKKKEKKDPPPVFIMPDGMSYLHVNRNGLIFGCATEKNVSPCTVIEVRYFMYDSCMSTCSKKLRGIMFNVQCIQMMQVSLIIGHWEDNQP
jgi:AP-4 complex subunit mu-1